MPVAKEVRFARRRRGERSLFGPRVGAESDGGPRPPFVRLDQFRIGALELARVGVPPPPGKAVVDQLLVSRCGSHIPRRPRSPRTTRGPSTPRGLGWPDSVGSKGAEGAEGESAAAVRLETLRESEGGPTLWVNRWFRERCGSSLPKGVLAAGNLPASSAGPNRRAGPRSSTGIARRSLGPGAGDLGAPPPFAPANPRGPDSSGPGTPAEVPRSVPSGSPPEAPPGEGSLPLPGPAPEYSRVPQRESLSWGVA